MKDFVCQHFSPVVIMKDIRNIINQETAEEGVENESIVSSKFKKQKEEFRYFKVDMQNQKKDKKEIIKERKKQKNFRSARLIVRNLPFKSSEKQIKDHFSSCGEVVEVNVLKKGDRLIGCCFVQYSNKLSAAKAIHKLSGKQFMGRPIVVDWALAKDKFNKLITKEVGTSDSNVKIKEEDVEVKEEDDDSDSNSSNESGEEDADRDSSSNSEEDSSSEEKDSSGEESDMDTDEKPDMKNKKKDVNVVKKDKKFHFQYDSQDVSDGRTVFFKNVPFSANDDDLLNCVKELGTVVYAVICVDPLTEHSKGTAFVKFTDKSVVDNLIQGKSKLVLKGAKLDAFLALKKNQIADKKQSKVPKDNRHLYLLREGVILAGSPAAEGLSESDMAKRLQLEQWKTQTLRNLNKFVSTNRLVVHNLPPFVDDKKLRQIFKENSPKGSFITESRVMRNFKDIDEKGVGQSKGFGFVCFSKHEDALEALRNINNNPSIFKENKRPIVGFSIENRVALREKEKRKTRSLNAGKKQADGGTATNNSSPKDNSRKRKFSSVEEKNMPKFCGYTAKPGAKKMRSTKELKVQAALHHKAVVEKKREKKLKKQFGRKFKNKKNPKKK